MKDYYMINIKEIQQVDLDSAQSIDDSMFLVSYAVMSSRRPEDYLHDIHPNPDELIKLQNAITAWGDLIMLSLRAAAGNLELGLPELTAAEKQSRDKVMQGLIEELCLRIDSLHTLKKES
jgi:hypothetical protein